MKLFKENSYEIIRLFINQVGITIFSLVLYTGLSISENKETALKITILLSVFATLFYLVLLYFAGWEYGAKDKIRIDSGKHKFVPFKGAKLSLIANSLNILIAVLSVGFFSISMAGGSMWFDTVARIFNMIMRFTSAMYHGMIQGIITSFPSDDVLTYIIEAACFGLYPLLAIGATQLGYSLGMRNIKISSLFKGKAPSANNENKD